MIVRKACCIPGPQSNGFIKERERKKTKEKLDSRCVLVYLLKEARTKKKRKEKKS